VAELGEEPVGAAARNLQAHLILVASDASDHTWRRAKSFAAGTDQQCIRVSYNKDQMGMAIGRVSLAIAAITDVQMALAMAKALPEQPAALVALEEKSARVCQRKKEAQAHKRNVAKGRKK